MESLPERALAAMRIAQQPARYVEPGGSFLAFTRIQQTADRVTHRIAPRKGSELLPVRQREENYEDLDISC